MTYDPRTLGAECDRCPLGPNGCLRDREWRPLEPELHPADGFPTATVAAVMAHPSEDDTRRGFIFAGREGAEWGRWLSGVSLARSHIDLIPAYSCQPPGKDSSATNRLNSALRRKRKAAAQRLRSEDPKLSAAAAGVQAKELYPHPAECCAPRLKKELSHYQYVITLGRLAAASVLGTTEKMSKIEGSMYERTQISDQMKAVATYSPKFICAKQSRRPGAIASLSKAFRFFRGETRWTEPEWTWQPSAAELREWLAVPAPFWVVDYETNSLDPKTCETRCLAITTPDLRADGTLAMPWETPATLARTVVLNILGSDGYTKYYSAPVMAYQQFREGTDLPDAGELLGCFNTESKITLVYQDAAHPGMTLPKIAADLSGIDHAVCTKILSELPGLVPESAPPGWLPAYHIFRPSFEDLDEERQIMGILREFMRDPTRQKAGHNFGYYDLMVTENWLGVTPVNVFDTVLATRHSDPEGAKGLKTKGRQWTDIHHWETDESGEKNSSGQVSDRKRGVYCGYDTTVNSRIYAPVVAAAREAGAYRDLPEWAKPVHWPSARPWNLMEVDHVRQELGVQMHKNGLFIDEPLRARFQAKFTKIAGRLRLELEDRAKRYGMRAFNPNSHPNVVDLLYSKLRLRRPPDIEEKDFLTDGGQPGTGAAVCRGHIANPAVPPELREFLITLLQYRRVTTKILGTQLKNAAPAPLGRIDSDGRGRANWNTHSMAEGRFSASGFPVQTFSNRKDLGGVLRIYRAAPGNVFVGADLSAAHLVNAANFWHVKKLVECFETGLDPHLSFAYAFLGDKLKQLSGWGPLGFGLTKAHKPKGGTPAGNAREYGKNHRYAAMYEAALTTVLAQLRASENTWLTDDDRIVTEFPNLALSMRKVELADRGWRRAEPEWREATTRELQRYHENGGYLESYIFRRRSGGLEGGKPTKIANFPHLSTEQDVMAICELRAMHSFPFQKWGPGTGIILQTHDAIKLEVPEALAELAAAELQRCMTVEVPGCPVPYTSEVKIGRTLADV